MPHSGRTERALSQLAWFLRSGNSEAWSCSRVSKQCRGSCASMCIILRKRMMPEEQKQVSSCHPTFASSIVTFFSLSFFSQSSTFPRKTPVLKEVATVHVLPAAKDRCRLRSRWHVRACEVVSPRRAVKWLDLGSSQSSCFSMRCQREARAPGGGQLGRCFSCPGARRGCLGLGYGPGIDKEQMGYGRILKAEPKFSPLCWLWSVRKRDGWLDCWPEQL